MVLNNVYLIDGAGAVNVQVIGKTITAVTTKKPSARIDILQLNFKNALVFPGLINSHDHLDFNLFPKLGNKTYPGYTEWGKYIHSNYKDEIAAVLKVPVALREQWGIIKNLLCGVTTVVNHGERIKIANPLITVHQQYYCIHSVQFERFWWVKLNNPLKIKFPVVIHTGEGTNDGARDEINRLLKSNLLKKSLIGVHGVAMLAKQAKKFKALIWCPQSNFFLLDKTAEVNQLKAATTILFGTDSTLTGHWNIWDHINIARKTKMLSDRELYNTLTCNPAAIWGINCGEIKEGQDADLVVSAITNGKTGLNAFFATTPKDLLLVVQQGNVRLFDASLYNQLSTIDLSLYSKINIEGVVKYVQADVAGLMSGIQQIYPEMEFPITMN